MGFWVYPAMIANRIMMWLETWSMSALVADKSKEVLWPHSNFVVRKLNSKPTKKLKDIIMVMVVKKP
ncbi:hypothetical protein RchiOBHm_Chr3g0491941 [Rosa chinensis]|uniref:Uncharacterized protein n=1 Tax=Rosa chinensis TaxID=74649 RepID=A0A2P6RGD6_ROSCH|nr:hypothetical protein RchiOBHm_Chr3g0491941 [Rosa chinensis]